MLPHRASIVIIGGGIIGSAIFAHLTKSHVGPVVLLEKNQLAAGATRWSAGIVRRWSHSQAPSPLRLYRDLLCHSSRCTPTLTPTIHFSPASESRRFGAIPTEPGMRGNFGYEQVNNDEKIEMELDTGYYDPVATTRALAAIGRANGGMIIEGVAALRLITGNGVATGVHTNRGTIQSGTIILSTGAWIERMSQEWNLDLPIKARAIQAYRLQSPHAAPSLPIFIDSTLNIYGRGDGSGGALVGMPVAAEGVINPDMVAPTHPKHRERTLVRARRRFPVLQSAAVESAITGSDGYTVDGVPLVHEHSQIRSLYIAAGFSGGGFKQAPYVARTIASLIHN